MKSWENFNKWLDRRRAKGYAIVGWSFQMNFIDARVEVDWDGRFRVDRIYFDERGIVINGGRCMAIGTGTYRSISNPTA